MCISSKDWLCNARNAYCTYERSVCTHCVLNLLFPLANERDRPSSYVNVFFFFCFCFVLRLFNKQKTAANQTTSDKHLNARASTECHYLTDNRCVFFFTNALIVVKSHCTRKKEKKKNIYSLLSKRSE